jgi:hypothetical protein
MSQELNEERGHDGMTSEERIAQLTLPPQDDWYGHQIAIVNKRNAQLERTNTALLGALKEIMPYLNEVSDYHRLAKIAHAAIAEAESQKENGK